MKVNVTVTEVLWYEITKEVEMTKKEYQQYLKTGKYNIELEHEVSSYIDDEHWVYTERRIDNIEQI